MVNKLGLEQVKKLIDTLDDEAERIEDGNGDFCFGATWAYKNQDVTDVTICYDGSVVVKYIKGGIVSEETRGGLTKQDVIEMGKVFDIHSIILFGGELYTEYCCGYKNVIFVDGKLVEVNE